MSPRGSFDRNRIQLTQKKPTWINWKIKNPNSDEYEFEYNQWLWIGFNLAHGFNWIHTTKNKKSGWI